MEDNDEKQDIVSHDSQDRTISTNSKLSSSTNVKAEPLLAIPVKEESLKKEQPMEEEKPKKEQPKEEQTNIMDKTEQKIASADNLKNDDKVSNIEVKPELSESNITHEKEQNVPENSTSESRTSALRSINNTEDSKLLSGNQIHTMVKQINSLECNRVNSPIQYEDDEDEREDYSGSDTDLDFELEIQQLQLQVSHGVNQINSELKQSRIDRIDKYLEIIADLKKNLSENYEKNFQNVIKNISPSLDSKTGLDLGKAHINGDFGYPLKTNNLKQMFLGIAGSESSDNRDQIQDFPVFTKQFNKFLTKDQKSFKILNSRYKYEFDQIESLKTGNTFTIWKQFKENVKQAKKRKLQLLEEEMCDIERKLYNIKPEYSSASQFASRVPEFANVNDKEKYISRREDLDGVYRRFQIVPSSYEQASIGPLRHVSPAESAKQDLQIIDMIVNKKRRLESQHFGLLDEVLTLHDSRETSVKFDKTSDQQLADGLTTVSEKTERSEVSQEKEAEEKGRKELKVNREQEESKVNRERKESKVNRERGKINLADLL